MFWFKIHSSKVSPWRWGRGARSFEARPGRFYLLPKIHKGTLPPPGRPIVSAIKSPTEIISQFLDHFLQPCFPQIKSYVKDTGHFIFLLEEIGALPGPTLLATFDVTSLYTNVPLEEARKAVGRSLLCSRHSGDVPHTESLLHLLKLVFTKNIFSFSNGENLSFYLQTNGVSMGSKCAPAVACIFMAQFEETFVYSLQTSKRPSIWLRYIDDIFCIWPHGPEKLASFTEYLNSCHPKIKFTCDSSPHCIDFLDVRVHLTNGRLTTELFTKPTSSLAYLLRSSYHPRRVFDALPYGEFVRTRRNCSTLEKYDSHSNRLLQAFLERGYNLDQLEKARSKARQLSRQDILDKYALPVTPQITPSSPPDQFYLTVKFFQSSHLVRDLIKQNWTVLGKSETTTSLYENKLVISYKRNPRLRDMLVKSSIPIIKIMANLVNPPTLAMTPTASTAHTLICLGISSRRRLKNVIMPKSMSAVTAAIWSIVSHATHVRNNMLGWPNVSSDNAYTNTYVTYARVT